MYTYAAMSIHVGQVLYPVTEGGGRDARDLQMKGVRSTERRLPPETKKKGMGVRFEH